MHAITTLKGLGARIQIVLVAFAVFWTGFISTFGQVPAADVTVLPVITDNLPVICATTAYEHTESEFATNTNYALPLYMPYNGQADPKYWDYLVQEQQQARIPVIMLISAGYPWNGNGVIPNNGTFGCNPYYIPQYLAALQRAGLSNTVKFCCCPFGVQGFYDSYYKLPSGSPVDFANEDSWTNVWWNDEIGPFFASVPKNMLYRLRGGVPLQFWGLSSKTEFTNQQGNLSRFFNFISNKVMSTYGVPVTFDVCDTATNYDTTLQTLPHVIAMNPWFNVNTGYGFTTFFTPGLPNLNTPTTVGTIVPGFNNGNLVILRNNPAGTGTMGDTFKAGLDAAVASKADLASIEGWIDPGEGCASYRCSTESVTNQSGNWLYPNQYVNMTRSYADLRTSTLKLEAESCDKYNDPGGVGGVFRRNPSTLDCAALATTGWVVSNTKAGEWLEWDGVTFTPGNYKFPVCYSSTAMHTLQLQVDGVSLPSVQVPSTGGMNTYATAYLGTKAISNGTHTIKLLFIDGGPNIDWIFLKKSDPQLSFQSAYTGKYVTANLGGNNTLVSTQSYAAAWENFTVDDLAATSGTINSGDSINLQSYDGLYVTAESGGGANVSNNRRSPGSWETFTIVKVSGSGSLANGTQVALKSANGNYLTVGRDGTLNATATTIGLQQTFTIAISQLATPPAAPSNLVATAASGSQINLTWTNNATNATACVIERSTDGGVTYTPIAMVAGNATSYSNTGLSGYTPYMYEVCASNTTARSDFTEPASVTTLSGPPGAPTGLVASIAPSLTSASTVLDWTASPGTTSYTVKRGTVSQGPYTSIGTTSNTTYTDSTGTLNTTYYYVVSASNASGGSSNSLQVSSKPIAFQQVDIGTGTTSGNGSYSGGVFTLNGSGRDINGSSDVFHYVYLPLYGDCTITAHLASLSSSNGSAKSGIMMRQTLAANDEYAMMSITPANGSDFQYRLTTGGGTGFNSQISGIVVPQWLTLTRSGSSFQGSYSPDGLSWYNSNPMTIPMSGTINLGLEESMISTGTFDNVLITPNQEELPPIPTGLSASLIPTASNSQVQLSWTNIPSASWYNVLRSTTNGGGPYTNIGSPHASVFTDTTAINGTTYYYVIQTVAGSSISANSAQLAVNIADVPVGRKISLQSRANNLWVTAGSAPLIASAASAGTNESFNIVDESGPYGAGAFALQAQANGLYVTAANSTTALIANSSTVGVAQVFYWNDYGNGTISFSSLNNQMWVCADNTGSSPLIANRTIAAAWETYTLKLW